MSPQSQILLRAMMQQGTLPPGASGGTGTPTATLPPALRRNQTPFFPRLPTNGPMGQAALGMAGPTPMPPSMPPQQDPRMTIPTPVGSGLLTGGTNSEAMRRALALLMAGRQQPGMAQLPQGLASPMSLMGGGGRGF